MDSGINMPPKTKKSFYQKVNEAHKNSPQGRAQKAVVDAVKKAVSKKKGRQGRNKRR